MDAHEHFEFRMGRGGKPFQHPFQSGQPLLDQVNVLQDNPVTFLCAFVQQKVSAGLLALTQADQVDASIILRPALP